MKTVPPIRTAMPDHPEHDPDRAAERKSHRGLRLLATLAIVAAAACFALWAYRFYEYSPWTRDGRVRVYVVDTAPEVSGLVVDVPVRDNQFVRKGDLLYRVDPRDYQATVDRAEAALDSARQAQQLQQDSADRRRRLRQGDVSAEEKQTYSTNAVVQGANVKAAAAALSTARLNLERCDVRSTVNGWVTNLTVRPGDFADAGHRQMSVIDADSFYVYAYFEETQLRNVGIGDPARAVLMGYPAAPVRTHVDSVGFGVTDINAAVDAQGLPTVNPIFTWVRLAQRIPVRLHIDAVPADVHLAAGETCTVYVERK